MLEVFNLAKDLEKTGFGPGAKVIRSVARSLSEIGLIPDRLSTSKEPQETSALYQATEEYRENPTDPEKATNFWQAFWAENGRKVDILISVPKCPFTSEQLENMRRKGKGPIYVPKEVSTQENRHLLGKMFPKMQSRSVEEENNVINETQNFGWRRFDMSIDAPYRGTKEDQLVRAIAQNGEKGSVLNEYIVAGQASKLLTGKYLDEGATISRILRSRLDGHVVNAYFGSGGDLYVPSHLPPDYCAPGLGGRGSSGVN